MMNPPCKTPTSLQRLLGAQQAYSTESLILSSINVNKTFYIKQYRILDMAGQ